ncbi:MAG: hypothetical protein M3Y93_03185 [Pseudomonadota bacterium]|nr:hypothetical protein [Pseudomonadota bacterium]
MKRLSTMVLLGALTATGSAAATGSFSLNQFNSGVMPVLVQVNAHGKVTRVSPSTQLAPRYERLLRKNIQELVTGPARNHDKQVSSQFVMNVTLKTAPRADGSYDAQFAYVSAEPVPAGPMHWVSFDGHRLALARDGDMFRPMDHAQYSRSDHQSYPSHYENERSAPATQPTSRSIPSPSPNAQSSSRGR